MPIRGKTDKQKLSTNLTLYEAFTNHWIKFRRAETKRKKEFNLLQGKNSTFLEAGEKETSNTISSKKNNSEKTEKYYTNEVQTRNTKVQINEEEIGKLLGREFRIMIVKMIKTPENKMEKMQESINKDLEELKKKHTETAQLLKLKIL